jgi:hypothetical protein
LREQAQKLATAVAVFQLGQAELQAQQQAGQVIARAQLSSVSVVAAVKPKAAPVAPAAPVAAPKPAPAAAAVATAAPTAPPSGFQPTSPAKDDTDWETF